MVKNIRPLTDEQIEQLKKSRNLDAGWPQLVGRSHRIVTPRRDWWKTLLIFAFGFFLAVVCFAEGVDRGTTAGIEACRSGDSVLVDPAVGGAG